MNRPVLTPEELRCKAYEEAREIKANASKMCANLDNKERALFINTALDEGIEDFIKGYKEECCVRNLQEDTLLIQDAFYTHHKSLEDPL